MAHVLASMAAADVVPTDRDARRGRRPAGPAAPASTLVEEDDNRVTWSGAWSKNPLPVNSGGSARLSMDAGAEARFTFSGTGVSWIGYRDQWSGIAEVLLDGERQTQVDTYAAPAVPQATLYTSRPLSEGRHTLVIRATGTHGRASAGSWIWVDGFSVTHGAATEPEPADERRPGRPSAGAAGQESRSPGAVGVARGRGDEIAREGAHVEQDDPALTWTGSWSSNRLAVHSAGEARLAMDPASHVTLAFAGTGVSWIGYRDEWCGIADVVLDGRVRATVDTYATPAESQVVLYTIAGLSEGTHTLTVQPTGRHRPASGGSWIWVDAFAVARGMKSLESRR
jgi:hypothetical protein